MTAYEIIIVVLTVAKIVYDICRDIHKRDK